MASQQAGQNAIAASGIADALIVSCDFVNYDYDKLCYEFKVGIKSESDPSGKITYFTAGTDHAVKCDQEKSSPVIRPVSVCLKSCAAPEGGTAVFFIRDQSRCLS